MIDIFCKSFQAQRFALDTNVLKEDNALESALGKNMTLKVY